MILIDTNALVVLLIGLINPDLVSRHKRTSIYEKQDFYDLLDVIEKFENLIVLPNIWTETDNLLNNFTGSQKVTYVQKITETLRASSEKYIHSIKATEAPSFYDLGLTDSLILNCAQECDLLITSDSNLSDYALANGIKVYDMIKVRNEKLK